MENKIEQQSYLLHKCLIYIADEIDSICKNNEIQYFLIAGSLLGAKRHKGIIPWDDDLDVGMLRKDYDRFLKVCESGISDELQVSNFCSEDHFGVPYIKLRLKGTHFIEDGCPEDLLDGIFVDIIPIDKMPKAKIGQTLQHFFTNIYKYVLLFNCKYDMSSTRQNFLIVSTAKLISKLPKKYLIRRLTFWQTFCNNMDSDYYINLCSSYPYGKEIFPKKAFSMKPLPLAEFEGRQYSIPYYSDEILQQLYGDYWVLPPKEKQVFRHTNKDIDFGRFIETHNLFFKEEIK